MIMGLSKEFEKSVYIRSISVNVKVKIICMPMTVGILFRVVCLILASIFYSFSFNFHSSIALTNRNNFKVGEILIKLGETHSAQIR